jgi:hypothetical protein
LNEYTIDQVVLFVNAARKNMEEQLQSMSIQLRFAYNASTTEFENYLSMEKNTKKKKLSKSEITSTLGLPDGSE